MSIRQTPDSAIPASFASADYHTVLRLIAEGCAVVSITNTGSHCPLVEFDDSHARASSIAEAFKGDSIVPVIQRLAKLAEKR
jgi:hypothetical protein